MNRTFRFGRGRTWSADSRHCSARLCGDAGTAVIETALIAPILLYVILSIFEFGLVYRDYLTVTDAATDGAKTGSVVGKYTDPSGQNGDFAAIAIVRQDLANLSIRSIERIVIFAGVPAAAGDPVSQVPPSCKSGNFGPQPGARCNVYNPYDAFRAVQSGDTGYFTCAGGGESACGWNPATRKDGPKWYDIEYFGMYIKVDRPLLTGLFGSTYEVEAAAVVRLEPGQLS